jgi:hypothetical protein
LYNNPQIYCLNVCPYLDYEKYVDAVNAIRVGNPDHVGVILIEKHNPTCSLSPQPIHLHKKLLAVQDSTVYRFSFTANASGEADSGGVANACRFFAVSI